MLVATAKRFAAIRRPPNDRGKSLAMVLKAYLVDAEPSRWQIYAIILDFTSFRSIIFS